MNDYRGAMRIEDVLCVHRIPLYGQNRLIHICQQCQKVRPIFSRGMCNACQVRHFWDHMRPKRHCARCRKFRGIDPKYHMCRYCYMTTVTGRTSRVHVSASKPPTMGAHEYYAHHMRRMVLGYKGDWSNVDNIDRYVLVRRSEGATLQAVATELGVTRQRAAQREDRGKLAVLWEMFTESPTKTGGYNASRDHEHS